MSVIILSFIKRRGINRVTERLWSNGMISASQADDPGSIPGSRTKLFSEDIKLDIYDSGAVH